MYVAQKVPFPSTAGWVASHMSVRTLRRLVASGRGEALLYLRTCGRGIHDDLILSLCKQNQAFDRTFEDRSEYLWEIVKTSSEPKVLLDRVARTLKFARDESNRSQMLDILGHAFDEGHVQVAPAVIAAINSRKLPNEIYRASHLVGEPGLELAVKFSALLEPWERNTALEGAERRLGKSKARQKLKQFCKKYRKDPREFQSAPENPYRPADRLADPLAAILAGKWVKKADLEALADEDWRTLTEIVESSPDSEQIIRAQKAFYRTKRKFAGDLDQLILRVKRTDDIRIRIRLSDLAGKCRDRRVRAAALEFLQSSDFDDHQIGTRLLTNNARKEDWPLIQSALKRAAHDPQLFHYLTLDMRDFQVKLPTDVVEYLAEHVHCELCRGELVERLHRRRALHQAQLIALTLDSHSRTRESALRWVTAHGNKQWKETYETTWKAELDTL